MAGRILIIENHEGLLRAIVRNLRGRGFIVAGARTVGEGLSMLDDQDIVVVDLVLPDAPGTVVLRKIRRENRPIRVAVFTDGEDPKVLAEAKALKPDVIMHVLEIDKLLDWVGEA
jgi:DNA-binding response OmpR family regulator